MPPKLDIAAIRAAAAAIDPVFLDTPVTSHAALDAALGCRVVAKVETLNPIRSFKGRGTEWWAEGAARAGDRLICASAGNFGQGLVRAARRRGAHCTVFVANGASEAKIAAMRALGAEICVAGADFDAAKDAAREHATATGEHYVEDGAEPRIAEGAGTIGLELAAQAPDAEIVLVPLGNGALLAGVGTAVRHTLPRARVVGVVAARAPSMRLSLAAGRLTTTPDADTIADGVAVRVPVPEALAMLEGCHDDILEAEETLIPRAMRLIHETLGIVVEPSGALGVAAMLAEPVRFAGVRVATILCGGNLTPAQIAAWLTPRGESAR